VIYNLTETLHFISKSDGNYFTGEAPTSIFPGLVDGDFLREQIGDALIDYLVELGRLVPQT